MFSTKQYYDIHAVAAELAENERTKSNIPTNKKPTCTSNLKVINGIKYNSIQWSILVCNISVIVSLYLETLETKRFPFA